MLPSTVVYRFRRAFTLLQMMMVIAIIGIIASFAIPAATKMIRGTDVARGAQMLTDQLAAARQTAIAHNKQIEVRFLRFADPESPRETSTDEATWKIRGIQLMEVTGSGVPVPVTPMVRLPAGLVLDPGEYSSLFGETPTGTQTPLQIKNPSDLDPPMPRLPAELARRYSYAAFRYFPDGSTSLSPKGNWFLTLRSMNAGTPIHEVDYFTLQVDPISGATRSYRPQIGS